MRRKVYTYIYTRKRCYGARYLVHDNLRNVKISFTFLLQPLTTMTNRTFFRFHFHFHYYFNTLLEANSKEKLNSLFNNKLLLRDDGGQLLGERTGRSRRRT